MSDHAVRGLKKQCKDSASGELKKQTAGTVAITPATSSQELFVKGTSRLVEDGAKNPHKPGKAWCTEKKRRDYRPKLGRKEDWRSWRETKIAKGRKNFMLKEFWLWQPKRRTKYKMSPRRHKLRKSRHGDGGAG